MRIKVHGLPKVTKNMERYEKLILDAARKAMIKGAMVDVETGAKKKITQDGHIDTGRLRASIHTSYKGKEIYNYSDNDGKGFQARLDVRYKQYNVFVGTDVHYSEKIEMLDSYLFYAYKNGQAKIPERIKQEISKLLKKGG